LPNGSGVSGGILNAYNAVSMALSSV
jgi:hypothetical protein